jgi:hypothetical protein
MRCSNRLLFPLVKTASIDLPDQTVLRVDAGLFWSCLAIHPGAVGVTQNRQNETTLRRTDSNAECRQRVCRRGTARSLKARNDLSNVPR